jgi:ribosomal subunit interface protein
MRVTITARHCDVSDELRERARAQIARLARLARRPDGARVLFAEDAGKPMVELQLHTALHLHVASAPATDHRTALDLALSRMRRQLVRDRETPRARRRVPK